MNEVESLFLGAFLGSLFSFAFGYFLHYAIEGRKRRNDLSKAAESITTELEDMQKDSYDSMTVENAGKLFQSSVLSIDSIIYSGLIREFDTKTQIVLIKTHGQINTINILLREALEYYRQHQTPENHISLNDYQKKKVHDLSDLIPGLIEQLKPYIR
jgi:hypothetical protein